MIISLEDHIDAGNWKIYFTDDEIGHSLTFSYNLIKWVFLDNADILEYNHTEFVWSKKNQVIGTFPLHVPEPTPIFTATLITIFERDKVIQQYVDVVYDEKGVFTITYK